jgi:16S rRNA (adenine1518-N6/adenine1519-N6)-dimethyltransferase
MRSSRIGPIRRPARKRFGQHFLERAWVEKVIRAIDPKPDDVFVEIGPGRGALTRPLAAAAGTLVAFEIDRDLAGDLRAESLPNLAVVEGDFLDQPAAAIRAALGDRATPGALRVAGNLPYNVASPIMFKLLELYQAGIRFADATLMVQREVADRLLAHPGTREYGVLTVLIGHRAAVERLLAIPPGAFRPPPKVESALVRLRFHAPQPPVNDPAVFAGVTQAIFTRRRKTLGNALLAFPAATGSLAPGQVLARAGIDGTRRPETLSIPELARLADAFAGAVL